MITYSILSGLYRDYKITPYLFYFTPKRMKGNPYVPESYIFRGDKFFKLFTDIDYNELDSAFKNISESNEINKKFDDMTSKILDCSIIR